MNIHQDLRNRLHSAFEPLKRSAGGSLPSIGYLSNALANALNRSGAASTSVVVSREIVGGFATAAIEIWLRAVHSFLVSCALTAVSPVWSSVTGYYASHYTVRALAHILGHFQLFRLKKVVRLEFSGGMYHCVIEPKRARSREHLYYWRVVKEDPQFASDPLFTLNVHDGENSEVSHRDRANYADHVGALPNFRVSDEEALKNRIAQIARIQFGAPPIPRVSNFPDVESVQIVAYHRIVRFRQILDEGVGVRNRFWNAHRQPSWTGGLMDFQLTEQGGVATMTRQQ